MSGLDLTLHQRLHIQKGRSTVRPPTPDEGRAVAAVARETQGRRVEGIPLDVLMTLEAVRQLAEQGNLAAKWLYEQERERLGIDRPLHIVVGDPR